MPAPQASPKPTLIPAVVPDPELEPEDDDETEPAETVDPNADLAVYVVRTAAITYRVRKGKESDAVRRFVRGNRLRLHSGEQRVKELVHSGSIVLHDNHVTQTKATPREVFSRIGAADDPAEPPVQEILPITPDATVTKVAPKAKAAKVPLINANSK